MWKWYQNVIDTALCVRGRADRGPVVILIPTDRGLSSDIRKRLAADQILVLALADILKKDASEPLELALPQLSSVLAPERSESRLVIDNSAWTVYFDGAEKLLSSQEDRLLVLLAENAIASGKTAETRDIEANIWGSSVHLISRQVSDVVRELRDKLAVGAVDAVAVRAIIQYRRNPNGYRLTLAAHEIEIRP